MKYFPEPEQNKQYKSLSDTYSELYQPIRENVQIIGIPDGMEQEEIGSIPDDYYARLKRVVLSKGEGGTEWLVKSLLRMCDWPELTNVDNRIMDVFLDYDVDLQVLNKIYEKKKAGNCGRLESCLKKPGVWSLTEALDPLVMKLSKNWKDMFFALCNVQPKIDTVSTGPGEIAISMFTNAVKGKVSGDLYLNGEEIEVKGEGGRLGSSDYTKGIFNGAVNKYLQVLADRSTRLGLTSNQHFTDVEKSAIVDDMMIDIEDAIPKLKKVKGLTKRWIDNNVTTDQVIPTVSLDFDGDFEQTIKVLEQQQTKKLGTGDLVKTIPATIESTLTSLGEFANSYPAIMEQKGGITGLKGIFTICNKIAKLASKALAVTPGKKSKYNWQDSVQYMFNHDWGMTARELAEAFVEMRTEELDPGHVASLIDSAEKFFKNKDIAKSLFSKKASKRGGTSDGQKALQKLQIALMATSYQAVHGFPHLLTINPHTLNAATLKFKGTTMGKTMENIYKQLESNPNIIVSNPSVDTRNKGIGISLAI